MKALLSVALIVPALAAAQDRSDPSRSSYSPWNSNSWGWGSSGSIPWAPSAQSSGGGSGSDQYICSNALPLTSIGSASWNQPQLYQGSKTLFTFALFVCSKGSTGQCDDTGGFLKQFSYDSGECQFSMDQATTPWQLIHVAPPGPNYYFATFQDSLTGNSAEVTIDCDPDASSQLEASGDVTATNTGSTIFYRVPLKSNVCHRDQGSSTPGWSSYAPSPSNGYSWSSYAPSNPSGSWSPSGGWSWSSYNSYTPSSNNGGSSAGEGCSLYSNSGCLGCTRAPSGNCGYCLQTKTCEYGSSNGAAGGSCPSEFWEWYPQQCTD